LICHNDFTPDSCSFFIKTKNFSLTHVDTWFTYFVNIWGLAFDGESLFYFGAFDWFSLLIPDILENSVRLTFS